jgi:small subunit ribosomal protein S15
VAFIAVPLAVGLAARAETFSAPFPAPSVWSMHAVDWPYFRNQFSYVVSQEDHRSPTTTDPFSLGAHAYGAARETASGLLRDDRFGDLQTLPVRPGTLPARGWWQGVGDALGSYHQNRLDGTLPILRTSRLLLDDTPGADDAARQRALRGVAAWQMHAADEWIRAIDRHDASTYEAVHAALDTESAAVADAGADAASDATEASVAESTDEVMDNFTEDLLDALALDEVPPLSEPMEQTTWAKAEGDDTPELEPSPSYVNGMTVEAARAKYKLHESDTGSAQVQIAVLTARITYMTKHMQQNKKDYASLRGLQMMVARRRKLLEYLLKEDLAEFKRITSELGIRANQLLKPKLGGARGRRV